MGWFQNLGHIWLNAMQWLVGLGLLFGVLSRCCRPCNPGMHWWNDYRSLTTDLLYWFLSPLYLGTCRTLMLAGALAVFFHGRQPEFAQVRGLPLWSQCLLILVIQDFLMYWMHRAFHSRAGWKFHAAHHSPTELDWLSVVRFHPVNLLEFALADVVVVLLGFHPAAIVALIPLNFVHSSLVHANLDWTFGPFRYVIASPVFHRWHHTTEAEGLDTNFAPTFPITDLIFGTFYMPVGQLPKHFGNGDSEYPQDFVGQILRPFAELFPQAEASPATSQTVPELATADVSTDAAAQPLAATSTVSGAALELLLQVEDRCEANDTSEHGRAIAATGSRS